MKYTVTPRTVTLRTVLVLIFLVLKLTGNFPWSWFWVLAPWWIPPTIFFAVWLMFVLMLLTAKWTLIARSSKPAKKHATGGVVNVKKGKSFLVGEQPSEQFAPRFNHK